MVSMQIIATAKLVEASLVPLIAHQGVKKIKS